MLSKVRYKSHGIVISWTIHLKLTGLTSYYLKELQPQNKNKEAVFSASRKTNWRHFLNRFIKTRWRGWFFFLALLARLRLSCRGRKDISQECNNIHLVLAIISWASKWLAHIWNVPRHFAEKSNHRLSIFPTMTNKADEEHFW